MSVLKEEWNCGPNATSDDYLDEFVERAKDILDMLSEFSELSEDIRLEHAVKHNYTGSDEEQCNKKRNLFSIVKCIKDQASCLGLSLTKYISHSHVDSGCRDPEGCWKKIMQHK